MSLHDKKGLGKKDKKGWCCDKILVHLKEFAPKWLNQSINIFSSYWPLCLPFHIPNFNTSWGNGNWVHTPDKGHFYNYFTLWSLEPFQLKSMPFIILIFLFFSYHITWVNAWRIPHWSSYLPFQTITFHINHVF